MWMNVNKNKMFSWTNQRFRVHIVQHLALQCFSLRSIWIADLTDWLWDWSGHRLFSVCDSHTQEVAALVDVNGGKELGPFDGPFSAHITCDVQNCFCTVLPTSFFHDRYHYSDAVGIQYLGTDWGILRCGSFGSPVYIKQLPPSSSGLNIIF